MRIEGHHRYRFCWTLWRSFFWNSLASLLLWLGGASHGVFGADRHANVSILSSNDAGIKIQVVPGSYPQRLINLQGKDYQLFEGTAAAETGEGMPLLPTEGILLGIPIGASVSLEVTDASYEVLPNQLVAPVPHNRFDDENNAYQEFVVDETAYSKNAWYPSSNVGLLEMSQIRHQRVAKILLYPYQFNPVTRELKKLTSLTLNLRFTYPSQVGETRSVQPA
ncbi:MAG: C25 family peptidase propeptide domain-containing protein, partial [Bacteroidota bacterium]